MISKRRSHVILKGDLRFRNERGSCMSSFREALASENPLQIAGTINAFAALLAEKEGFKALYLSGAGVANYSYGLPDLGMTTLDNVLEDARRITEAVSLPLLVDVDTGWGNALMIERTIKKMIKAEVSAVQMEDQVFIKRCGHRKGKLLVSTGEMVERLRAAVDARTKAEFLIMARTDAYDVEGLDRAIERAIAYKEAGADLLFAEAVGSLQDLAAIKKAVGLPLLANLTEFGRTPLFELQELAAAGVDMALYPLSAARAMSLAARQIYREIKAKGTQKEVLNAMQTRSELYEVLCYEQYEKKADQLIAQK